MPGIQVGPAIGLLGALLLATPLLLHRTPARPSEPEPAPSRT
ncbi:hypothetical protein [Streptomyces avidinii]